MELEQWIQTILNSTNGITPVAPSDSLFTKIQQKIKQQKRVAPQTIWLVAASIAVLVLLNFTVIVSKTKEKYATTTVYLENTLNQSNQLYQ
jgi:hypothetical protein